MNPHNPFVPKDQAEAIALFRAAIIGSLTARELSHGQLRAELRELTQKRYRPPGRGSWATRTYSIATLERWYYAYKDGGLEALKPLPRSDCGHARELPEVQRTLLCDIRKEHSQASASLIIRTLVADGRLQQDSVSESTVRRLFAERGLDRVSLRTGTTGTTRLRWQTERPGMLWHGDVCHGPTVTLNGIVRPLRIHALLDDCSRYVVGIESHHTELEMDMLGLLVRALRRHGPPDSLYLDNGATYRGTMLQLVCERLGITLLHARPYDPQARGKMERFWRTLRQGCLDFLGEVSSLDQVHQKLQIFLDTHYHQAPHASLMGKAPGIVYAEGRQGHKNTLTEDQLQKALTVYQTRRVRHDSTLSLGGKVFEVSQGFLAGHRVVVGRCFLIPGQAPWIEHEEMRFELHPVDPIGNSRRKRPSKRQAPKPTTPAVPFDPIGALAKSQRPTHHQTELQDDPGEPLEQPEDPLDDWPPEDWGDLPPEDFDDIAPEDFPDSTTHDEEIF